ncbi:helix-turn-helix transcriptional regulator [Spongiibacter sp. KMU-158]|uniref:Helix-turn-helix transcriptional regulator n=1 Tax=Spongiibacter pelagi TaxID=2760804 RepID=A0A927GWV7_9GAMM|nr:helix-turn-helix transcriptional regulator [Spongiibacter pelagi]|tara:strand:- start:87 stop:314 length:228 start_codon:yes stop_codon:yes gene_type:complete
MLRILFKQHLDDKSFRERRRITLQEVADETGLSRPTLSRISNQPGYSTTTDVLDALCEYFDCEPGDLIKRVSEAD